MVRGGGPGEGCGWATPARGADLCQETPSPVWSAACLIGILGLYVSFGYFVCSFSPPFLVLRRRPHSHSSVSSDVGTVCDLCGRAVWSSALAASPWTRVPLQRGARAGARTPEAVLSVLRARQPFLRAKMSVVSLGSVPVTPTGEDRLLRSVTSTES